MIAGIWVAFFQRVPAIIIKSFKSLINDNYYNRAGRGMFTQQQEEVRSKEKCKEEDTPLTLTIEKGVASGQ